MDFGEDIDSGEGDFYSAGEGSVNMSTNSEYDYYDECEDMDEIDDEENDFVEEETTNDSERKYTVLSEQDIRNRQEEHITEVCSVLSITRAQASILLQHHHWNVSTVTDNWFSGEEEVRKKVGFLENKKRRISKSGWTCKICFDEFQRKDLCDAGCGHYFCFECYKIYVSISINDGPGCLNLRCPDPACVATIDQDMVNKLVSEDDKRRYSRYLLRSYVESSKKIKWCPAPGCECGVEFEIGSENYNVSCECTHNFCWNCIEETHRPVDCSTVGKWVLKNSSESENTEWIMANSKPCPKCKRPIEKNQGCMHMKCTTPCGFQFCWLCLRDWSDHGEKTGGFYSCNTYKKAKEEGVYEEEEKKIEKKKRALEEYSHYYERWAANEVSRKKAVADLNKMKSELIENLADKQCQTEKDLQFVIHAWEQIIECRRVLKWSYAYGYYIPEREMKKTELFEYLQGEAESGLERLHQCVEKDLQAYLNDDEDPMENFHQFRIRLIELTNATKNYFENLVKGLENGLKGIETCGTASSMSTVRGRLQLPRLVDSWFCEHCSYCNESSATICGICNKLSAYSGAWTCHYCTCRNGRYATMCSTCGKDRANAKRSRT